MKFFFYVFVHGRMSSESFHTAFMARPKNVTCS